MRALMLWIGLAIAVSPALVDLAQHWWAEPWARYSLLFVPLWIACARRDRSPVRARADGYLWLAIGIALCVIAAGGGFPRFGRPGLAIAVVGMTRVLGAPGLACALLAAWVVPVPSVLVHGASGLEVASAHVLARGAHALGLEASVRPVLEGVELVAPAGALLLRPEDGGIALLALLTGIGWYAAARRGASVSRSFTTALRYAPWALLLQPVAILCAGLALSAGAAELARFVLQPGLWVIVATVALLRVHRVAAASTGAASPTAERS